jgi:integrase
MATNSTLKRGRIPGLFIRTMKDTKARAYVVMWRDANKKNVMKTLGSVKHLTREQAEAKAVETIKAIREGKSLDSPLTFSTVLEAFERHYVKERALRTAGEIHKMFARHVLPVWSSRDFASIKRGDVADLLNKIVEHKGPVAADKVLALLSKLMTWYAANHNDYASPIVRGMRRSNPKDRARTRILSDDELRAVWKAAEVNGVFGAFVRLSLLTGQRREKLASMKWSDLTIGDSWDIPSEAREKGNAGELVLPQEALAILKAMPRYASSDYVFTTGRSYIKGYSKMKAALDKRSGVTDWTIHDLRRTARSLMSRAHVQPLVAELVLGHVQKGVQAVYDRHEYREEKAHAIRALAGLMANILTPTEDKVVQLHG